jgi:hypothetical protein
MEKLFVYGILVDQYEDAIPATLVGYYKHIRGYATIRESIDDVVDGQLVELDSLDETDYIENYPEYYIRFRTDVELNDGTIERAWVYQQRLDMELDNDERKNGIPHTSTNYKR